MIQAAIVKPILTDLQVLKISIEGRASELKIIFTISTDDHILNLGVY